MTDLAEAFERLVRIRRDVRRFRPDPLPEGCLDRLLAIAHHAPSVGLSQPWRFVRVGDPERRRALAEHVDACNAEAAQAYSGERRARYERLQLHGLHDAPVVLGVYCDETTPQGRGLGAASMPEMRRYSCVTAVHTLWLAARAKGIGLGWVSILTPDVVDRLLDVPAGWHGLGLLCLGYPQEAFDRPELELRGWERRSDWRSTLIER
ncbi:5,6-dimethylbenzimidazole synthase [Litorisediminicola beolgyonensis]|uniref:5,6-dimethylbenzimidazole synthase n=1 Tax=Litorisediminicola beolgyonensis TaxID=1173614 RepID=A0ABW3ZLM1_9RHOB